MRNTLQKTPEKTLEKHWKNCKKQKLETFLKKKNI